MRETTPRTTRDYQLVSRLTPNKEAEQISKREDLVDHITTCELDRLILLKAFREGVVFILEKYLQKDELEIVLEVGCGLGFFGRWLAPDWLKLKLLSFDVNPLLTKAALEKDGRGQYFTGSIYRLPINDETIQTVIGYSSFDSLAFLTEALSETKRILKPKGKIILFQDLATNLYQKPSNPNEDPRETVERYHQSLCQEIEGGGFQILVGKEDLLSIVTAEKREEISARVPDFEWVDASPNFPMPVLWDRGYCKSPLRRQSREELKQEKPEILEEAQRWLEEKMRDPDFKTTLQEIKAGLKDIVQILTIRCLVAEKV